MDVWRITLAALRRWYILVPLLALTGWGALVVGNGFNPQYEVHATAMMTPGSVEETIPNPYGGLDDASQAVTIVLNSAESHEKIAAMGLSTTYEVTADSRSAIMQMTVRSDVREVAVDTGGALLDLAAADLTTRQSEAGVARGSQYSLSVLAAPSVINVVYDGKVRAQAIVGVLGASLALVIAVLFDDIIGFAKRARARRRANRDTVPVSSTPSSDIALGGDTGREEEREYPITSESSPASGEWHESPMYSPPGKRR